MASEPLVIRPPTDPVVQETPDVLDVPGEPTWENAFRLLARMTCVGAVSSVKVERWFRIMEKHNPEAAKVIMDTFNKYRTQWDQDMMG